MAIRGNIEDDPIIQGYLEDAGVGKTSTTQTEGDDNGSDTQDQQTDDKPGQQSQQQGADKTATKQDSGSGDANDPTKQVDKKEKGQGTDTSKVAKAGDLVLENGDIIRAGKERRWYESARVAKDQVAATERKVTEANTTIQQLRDQIKTHEQATQAIGASNPQEVSDSLRLFRDLRNNPTGTIQTLLAELAAAGVDLSSVVNGLDVKALSAILDQRGLTGQQQQQQADPNKQAEDEARAFATAHPDAMMHQDIIIGLVTKNPNMSLDQVYWALREQVAANGYDWSQPLGPQYKARNPQGQQQQQRQRQMPSGNGAGNQQLDDTSEVLSKTTAKDDDSLDSIVRSAMKETGYRQQS